MTGEYTYKLFTDHNFLQALEEISRAFSRKKAIQKELLASAWIAIAESDRHYTTEYYTSLGYAVMRHKYELYYMPVPKGKRSSDPGLQRVRRKVKQFVNTKPVY